jgi:hypothetical protein
LSFTLGTAQVVLALVFLAAAGGKMVKGRELAGALRLSGMPAGPARVLSFVVPAVELTLGVLLLITRGRALQIVLVAGALVMAAFTLWLGSVIVRKLNVRCSCFGANSKKVTPVTIVRNVLLVVLAIAGSVASGSVASPLPSTSVYWVMASTCFATVVLLGAGFNQVKGQLVLSLETMKRRRDMASGIET